MGVYPRFGGWINLNTQQPPKAESGRSENVESTKVPPIDPRYYDQNEVNRQIKLWRDAEKKHPWSDAPPKVKVTKQKGLCHMNIEMTVGYPPEALYEMFANPNNEEYSRQLKDGRTLLQSKSRKVLKKEGPREIVEQHKSVAWNFFGLSGAYPVNLISDENQKDLTGKYKKKKMMFMKVFEGSWKIEPPYVDQGRLCKSREPKSREEYKTCSGGQGKIGTKVTMEQRFQFSPPLNLPPLSWYIQGITSKTTKNLLEDFQNNAKSLREI